MTPLRTPTVDSIETALLALGNGFLQHPDNHVLRGRLGTGALGLHDFHRQLVWLVYRTLFLQMAHERRLLPDAVAPPRPHPPRTPQWPSLAARLRALDRIAPSWPMAEALPDLAAAALADGPLQHANAALWRGSALDGAELLPAEALGDTYEALLARTPQLQGERAGGEHLILTTRRAHDRRQTGSYYTPAPLVAGLLDAALTPMLDEACAKNDPASAILALSVFDPACGSGRFLLAAGRRMAARLAIVRTGSATPAANLCRQAMRDVVQHCLYGLDLNPMAVALCRMGLWLEAAEPCRPGAAQGLPTPPLHDQIRRGNALLGAIPSVLERRDPQERPLGLPDAAFMPLHDDDRRKVTRLRRDNAAARPTSTARSPCAVTDELQQRLADVWCAAFLAVKSERATVPTNAEFFAQLDGHPLPDDVQRTVAQLAEQHRWIHPHLAFPRVFERGAGFDVIVGNPPFLSQLDAGTALDRRAAALVKERSGGLVGGLADVAAAFLALHADLLAPGGTLALVVPQSFLATADARPIRAALAGQLRLCGLWVSNERVFADAAVFTCAPVLRRLPHLRAATLKRWQGSQCTPISPLTIDSQQLAAEASWSPLVADTLGIPPVALSTTETLADWASCTADFRDQYYGLDGFLVDLAEADDDRFAPLVTTGLLSLAAHAWGQRPARVLRQRWQSPRIDVARMSAEGTLADWMAARRRPKVLVATQTKVIEAYCDATGRLLPSVPLLSVVPRPEVDLWAVGAAVASPVTCAWAAARYAGAALTVGAIKLSARQLAGLPLPTERGEPWSRAVAFFQAAHQGADEPMRGQALDDYARWAVQCYGLSPAEQERVVAWWLQRLNDGSTGQSPAR
jgi:hypothetical protein